jgi:WXG100 family type VII secretion target
MPAGGRIGAVTPSLDSAQSAFLSQSEQLKTVLAQTIRAAENLRADWWGSGNESIEAVMARFHQTSMAMTQELDDIARNVGITSQAFFDLDTNIASSWNGFGG